MSQKQSTERIAAWSGLSFLSLLGWFCSHAVLPTGLVADPPNQQPESAARPVNVSVYDPDPQHLWNRIYSSLYVRVGQDGKAYARDELDPLLWPGSKYLLAQTRNREAIGLLDEFLAKDGEKMIKDPLKRAFLQRDLWAIFDWLADPDAEYQAETGRQVAERRDLRVRVAQVIRRLALSADQIQSLPDNYTAAVAAKALPTQHDPSHPDKAFLPSNLTVSNGSWVALTDTGAIVVAPQHAQFTRGRSSFFVLMNLPDGRKATLNYLEKLRTFPNPLMPRPVDSGGRFKGKFGPALNPELPQFPVGTQVALGREMLLIDDQGKITPTRLLESLQLRVYRDIPKADPKKLDQFDRLTSKQDFYEFRLRREDLP